MKFVLGCLMIGYVDKRKISAECGHNPGMDRSTKGPLLKREEIRAKLRTVAPLHDS